MIMSKKFYGYIAAFLLIAVVSAYNISLATMDKTVLSAMTLVSTEALAEEAGGNGIIKRTGHIDSSNTICTVTEAFTCSYGVSIPNWIPYAGGYGCYINYTYTKNFPGTQNLCQFTGNPANECFWFLCRKNGI
jgi:hypothetical protein